MSKLLIGKKKITGTIRLITGLHIKGGQDTIDIGGIDNLVVRNPISKQPYIPGSSLKGKLRSLFERTSDNKGLSNNGGLYRHECDQKVCEICRLFGSAKGSDPMPSRLLFRDISLTSKSVEEMKKAGIDTFAEIKSENTIDRITSKAMPRFFERVPAGAEFEFEIIYNIVNESEMKKDLDNLTRLFGIIENDYLGGHGSRGYGRIEIPGVKEESIDLTLVQQKHVLPNS